MSTRFRFQSLTGTFAVVLPLSFWHPLKKKNFRQLVILRRRLKKAFEQSSGDARYAVVYAIGLEGLGELDSAVKVLEKTLQSRPQDSQILELLQNYRAKAAGGQSRAENGQERGS